MTDHPLGVLAVLAHPDDEAFRLGGTLALLAQAGACVQVLSSTRGESGSCGKPPLCTREGLPALRESELRCSCRALGIEPPRFMGYGDGHLADVDQDQGVERVLAVIDELQPQVLITWPPDGLSGHPDHMAVSRWTQSAYAQTVAWQPAPWALYYLAVPLSVAVPLGLNQLRTVPDEQVDVAVDVQSVWEQKLAAIRCHRTQLGESPILAAPLERQQLFLGTEHFRRVGARQETDLVTVLAEG